MLGSIRGLTPPARRALKPALNRKRLRGDTLMLVGKKIGPFSIDKELGAGAMGAVYLGRHSETGQRVAIKIVAPGLTANKTAMRRFEREGAILKQLKHPNIVRLVLTGKFGSTP